MAPPNPQLDNDGSQTDLHLFLLSGSLESITKPRLSTRSEFCIFNRFPRGRYLVWLVGVRVRVSLGVRVRIRVRVRVRDRVSNLFEVSA